MTWERIAGRGKALSRFGSLLCVALTVSSSAAFSETRPLEVTARPIPAFSSGDATRFGRLDYVGGFSYSSRDPRMKGISAIRLMEGRSGFLAVTDTGYWFQGRILRDGAGKPIGIGGAEMAPILGVSGEPQTWRKGLADAEGLAIDGDRALVSFERYPRIEAYAGAADPLDSRPVDVAQPIPLRELRSNAGMEAIAVAPDTAPRGKRIVVVTEQSLDGDGNLFAALLGPRGGVFKVKREAPWHVTDAAFLPSGDLLLLERRYQSFGRIGMRIRQIAGTSIAPGALVDGEVLIDADLGQEIDNMEGLDVSVGADGATYIAIVSDDNGSFLQRNLYLEFRLVENASAAAPAISRRF